MKPEDFLNDYAPAAVAAMKKTGIPASVTLAQAILESGWGANAPENAFFGIKADKSWTGQKQLLPTTEVLHSKTVEEYKAATGLIFPEVISITPYGPDPTKNLWHIKDWFRAYATPEEGFEDHAMFFKQYGNYKTALLDCKDGIKFANDIAHAGYATAPNYAQTLITIINEFHLINYDE